MKTVFHALFGGLSLLLVFSALAASLIAELWYSQGVISEVNELVFQGMLLLLVILGCTAALGLSLGRTRQGRIVQTKKKRMFWILAITILALLPSTYLLNTYVRNEQFDLLYVLPQSIEYVFDVIVLILLGLNFRDGSKLVGRDAGELDGTSFF